MIRIRKFQLVLCKMYVYDLALTAAPDVGSGDGSEQRESRLDPAAPSPQSRSRGGRHIGLLYNCGAVLYSTARAAVQCCTKM